MRRRSRFLLALNGLQKDVQVSDEFGGGPGARREGFQKLAETTARNSKKAGVTEGDGHAG